MSGLFGGSSPSPPPPPQELEDQETKVENQERREKQKIASRNRARRLAQQNPLLTQRQGGSARGNAVLAPNQQTLGYARNIRNV